MTDEKKVPTTEKLAQAMREAKCPEPMIKRALAGYYDDYKSELATPCMQLVSDLLYWPLLRERAMKGEFDAQKWESDEWASDPATVADCKASGIPDVMLEMLGIKVKH